MWRFNRHAKNGAREIDDAEGDKAIEIDKNNDDDDRQTAETRHCGRGFRGCT